ncbi:hypothetical protein H5410_019398 [Solanum commersonii]|uniref:Isopentenyl phosphate kinase n=1 Tax=Solanum commersonii TaxID=4109 RepID=A0A9J5Z7A3_SOLCO|nr:hypothetical protein H5410_019398 [Solanum commersonii]
MEQKKTSKRLRCIVKLGGAAITCKNKLETIDEENLKEVSSQIRQAFVPDSTSANVIGMDWSKRPGQSEAPPFINDLCDQPVADSESFIVVHGAGSFGHFQASKSGVHKGGLSRPLVKAGFVATRISVTSLNLEIVRSLARGVLSYNFMSVSYQWIPKKWFLLLQRVFLPSECLHSHVVGQQVKEMLEGEMKIIFIKWIYCYIFKLFREKTKLFLSVKLFEIWQLVLLQMTEADISMVIKAIDTGFIPVLHGDAVLDTLQECTILSGDVIIRHLAAELKPEFVVFLVSNTSLAKTDVLGVYDRPPVEAGAVLIQEIAVREDGSWSVVKPKLEGTSKPVEFTVAAHDTTGGMVTKITEAAMIAKLGIDVYITKAGTDHSVKALSGFLKGGIPDDWLGTAIRYMS